MKKLLVLFAAMAICFSLIGCGEKEDSSTTSTDSKDDTTSSTPSNNDSPVQMPDFENMTEEEIEDYFNDYHFDFDEPIVLPDDES